MNFITKSTKVRCIAASVITGIALITLIMLSSLLTLSTVNKTLMCFIYTTALMLCLLLWHGVIQINVFNDYKCKRNYLCADGILSICMGTLLIVSATLFGILQADKAMNGLIDTNSDIRIFLTCFLGVMGLWKLAVTVLSIKEKHFNWYCELIYTIAWLALAIVCLLSMLTSLTTTMIWLLISFSWLIIVLTIYFDLLTYNIKKPVYLETDEALKILKEEDADRKARKKAMNAKYITKQSVQTDAGTVKEKLKRLKELKDSGLISNEDYEDKKAEILNNF